MKIKFFFGANTGFKAPCEPSRWKVEGLLTGFTIALLIFSRREKKGREFSLRAG
jgi:hypothetical protein